MLINHQAMHAENEKKKAEEDQKKAKEMEVCTLPILKHKACANPPKDYACRKREEKGRGRPEESKRNGGVYSARLLNTKHVLTHLKAMHAAQEQAKAQEDQKKAKEMEVCTCRSHFRANPTTLSIHTFVTAANLS
jgi:hypothetical protein